MSDSFLDQLRKQADVIRQSQSRQHRNLADLSEITEGACARIWRYVQDVCVQLNVLHPVVKDRPYSLDGHHRLVGLELSDFRCDARKKILRDKEVFDYISMGWELGPAPSAIRKQALDVNFSIELERVSQRLFNARFPHERKEIRESSSGKLLAYRFEYELHGHASLLWTADHDLGMIELRQSCVDNLQIENLRHDAEHWSNQAMDEVIKRILGQ